MKNSSVDKIDGSNTNVVFRCTFIIVAFVEPTTIDMLNSILNNFTRTVNYAVPITNNHTNYLLEKLSILK